MQSSQHRQNPIEMSVRTDHPTQRSHSKYGPAIEIEIMRERQEFKKQLQICYKQIETLKDQLHFKNQQIDELEKMNLDLRQNRNNDQGKFLLLMRDKEKCQRQRQKLRNDNESMELQLRRFQDHRKTTQRKLTDIKHLKEKMNQEILEKNKSLEDLSALLRKNDKTMKEYKLSIEQLSMKLSERERTLNQLQSEYKHALQNHLSSKNQINKLESKIRQNQLTNQLLTQKITQLQQQRQQLNEKIDEFEQYMGTNRSSMSHEDQISMMQIQSLMTQINSTINQKNDQKEKEKLNKRRLATSIQCLSKILKN